MLPLRNQLAIHMGFEDVVHAVSGQHHGNKPGVLGNGFVGGVPWW